VIGGHSGPQASSDSRTLYLKAGQRGIGDTSGYDSLDAAESALRSLTSGPKTGAAFIVEHEGRFYGQELFGLEVTGKAIAYDLEAYAKQGKVDAGILNSAVRSIVDGAETIRDRR
jgi:hypothetical protein